MRVGLADGRVLPLPSRTQPLGASSQLHDVVLVRVTETKGKAGARAELRVRPQVQGAVVVLENKTGRILAMVGGFSYPLSQLNRVDPGAAPARLGAQAADLSRGAEQGPAAQHAGARRAITLPPIGGGRSARKGLLDAEELRRRRRRHADAAARRSRIRRNLGDRAPARGRHRQRRRRQSLDQRLRAGAGGADLPRVRALLSVRARRPAGAADRSRGLLRRDRQRRPAADAVRDRIRSSSNGDAVYRHDPSSTVGSVRPTAPRSTSSSR